MKKILLLLLLLAGFVDANCFTQFEYCKNFTIPQSQATGYNSSYFVTYYFPSNNQLLNVSTWIDGVEQQSTYVWTPSFLWGNNTFNVLNVQRDLSNVYARVYNTTDPLGVKWNGPYRTTLGVSENIVYNTTGLGGPSSFITDCQNNISLLWVNRTSYLNGSGTTGTPSILEICLNGTYTTNVPVRDQIANPMDALDSDESCMGAISPAFMPGVGTCDYYRNLYNSAGLSYDCQTIILYPANFTHHYLRVWNFTDSFTMTPVNFTKRVNNLQVLCETTGTADLNMSAVWSNESQIYLTVERPRYVLTFNGSTYIRQDLERVLVDNFYITNSLTQRNSFLLKDWTTGQWAGSTLYIEEPINGTWDLVHVERYTSTGIIYPFLKNGTSYHLIIKTDIKSVDLGIIYLNGLDLDHEVSVSYPIVASGTANFWGNSSVVWSWDYDTGQIGAILTTLNTNMGSGFRVQNTSTGWPLIYNINGTGTRTYTYFVPDKTKDYYATIILYDDVYGTKSFSTMMSMYNETMPLNNSIIQQAPSSDFLGLSKKTWQKLIAYLTTLAVLMIACKATDYGIGSILGVALYMVWWFLAWIPHDEVPFWWIVVQMAMCVAAFMTQRRMS